MAKYRKLGRTSSQRKALLRGQVTSLIYSVLSASNHHNRIKDPEARDTLFFPLW